MAAPLSANTVSNLFRTFGITSDEQSQAQELINNINGALRNTAQANPTLVGSGASSGAGSLFALSNASDNAGTVTYTAAGTPTTGAVTTVTYATPYAVAPLVHLTPGSAPASAINAFVVPTMSGSNTTGFTINATTAPTATAVHTFNYMVMPGI